MEMHQYKERDAWSLIEGLIQPSCGTFLTPKPTLPMTPRDGSLVSWIAGIRIRAVSRCRPTTVASLALTEFVRPLARAAAIVAAFPVVGSCQHHSQGCSRHLPGAFPRRTDLKLSLFPVGTGYGEEDGASWIRPRIQCAA